MRAQGAIYFFIFQCLFVGLFADAVIAAPNEQSGDLVLEDTTAAQKKSPYAMNQENAIEWVKGLSAGTGKEADDGVLLNLAVSYLYCTVKTGVCSYMLDTVLESDFRHGTTTCPNMKKFWKAWLGNDLEQRLKYMLPIGYAAAVTTFNSSERPKYVKCEAKLAEWKPAKETRIAQITKTFKFLEEIKAKNINVMLATGVIGEQAPKAAKK